MLPLSILDLAFVPEGGTPAAKGFSLYNTVSDGSLTTSHREMNEDSNCCFVVVIDRRVHRRR